ncbi:hypothetical protein [Nonomuraea dietziae]|uniref:hypothetical protein n=1 Tax=Nonomuraea dietziae TaxID=65515 RepID=UPI0031E3EE4E
MSRGLAAEHALWNGDPVTALEHVEAVLGMLEPNDAATLRIAGTGLWAMAELGVTDGADDLIARARYAAAHGPDGERGEMGLEGRAWRLRAEAEWARAHGRSDPGQWREVVSAFSYGSSTRWPGRGGGCRRRCWRPVTVPARRRSGRWPRRARSNWAPRRSSRRWRSSDAGRASPAPRPAAG